MEADIFALSDAWRMAIRREEEAQDFYMRLAQRATDESLKTLFRDLAAEEAKHKKRLEEEYRRLFERDVEEAKARVGIFEGEPEGIHWYDWDEEAFRLAQALDVPILLAIGAVWCHWCHVMDRTTYSDPEVVKLVNAHFIPIWVDTDKRPDINSRYNMGGWPTVAFLTPEGEVIKGATYVSPERFKELLLQVSHLYSQQKGELQARIEGAKARRAARWAEAKGQVSPAIVDDVIHALINAFDPQYGGFGEAPKFPHPDVLELALAAYWRTGDEKLGEVVAKTSGAMARGGIYDQEMGGFFRYSTTRDWSVPHYEKMLEDNARLLALYLHAHQATGEESYRETAQGILDYVESTLWDEERGYFYGSQDADEEYYKLPKGERLRREAPFVDSIAYTSWNAMMASSYLEAGAILDEPRYGTKGRRALDFLWLNCRQKGRGMYHHYEWRGEAAGSEAHLAGLLVADQLWTVRALLDAYEHTGQGEYLLKAEELMALTYANFGDEKGGFFDRVADPKALGRLGERLKPIEENALAAEVALRLYPLTGRKEHQEAATGALESFAAAYRDYGYLAASYALAVDRFLNPPLSIVVVGGADDPITAELLRAGLKVYFPYRVLQAVDPLWEPERLGRLGYPPEPSPVAYACFGATCAAPATDPAGLLTAIESLTKRDLSPENMRECITGESGALRQ